MKKVILLVLFCIVIPVNTYAMDLFVESGSSGSGCTDVDPCGSIQTAVNLASPGDEIYIGVGTFEENVRILPGKDGIIIKGNGPDTVIDSAGGVAGVCAPCNPFVEADVVVDVLSPNVVIRDLSIRHSGTVMPSKRDLGVFVRPPASNVEIKNVSFRRDHIGETGFGPGSRGVFVFLATGVEIISNTFRGTYQDAIHIPTSSATVMKNDISGAPRVGIVIIQEPAGTPAVDSLVKDNVVDNSGGDGIQIQGDSNVVMKNTVKSSGGAGIKLCGVQIGDCVEPGDTAIVAVAENNIVKSNILFGNGEGDAVIDNGIGNKIK